MLSVYRWCLHVFISGAASFISRRIREVSDQGNLALFLTLLESEDPLLPLYLNSDTTLCLFWHLYKGLLDAVQHTTVFILTPHLAILNKLFFFQT